MGDPLTRRDLARLTGDASQLLLFGAFQHTDVLRGAPRAAQGIDRCAALRLRFLQGTLKRRKLARRVAKSAPRGAARIDFLP